MSQSSGPLLLVCCVLSTTTFAAIADRAPQQVQASDDGLVPHQVQHSAVVYLNVTLPALGHDVQALDGQHDDAVRGQINYSLGARVNGDQLVAHTSRNQQWPSPQNVKIVLTYPASGLGAQVTYVAIQVAQSNNLGKAYVVAGGLHQRMITIAVEAYNVVFVNYSAQFYGVP